MFTQGGQAEKIQPFHHDPDKRSLHVPSNAQKLQLALTHLNKLEMKATHFEPETRCLMIEWLKKIRVILIAGDTGENDV